MFNENVNVHIELTDKCNALCSMCGRQYIENGELKKVPTFDKNELSSFDKKTYSHPIERIGETLRNNMKNMKKLI